MKILHTVEFYSPSVGGAQEVVRRISEQLVRRGHEVTVATKHLPERTSTNINGVEVAGFAISGNQTRGYQGATDPYLRFLTGSKFDVMMNYAAQQWATDLAYGVLPEIPCRKVMAPCGFSGLFNPEYRSYFEELPAILRNYDRLIFHSNSGRDVDFARQHGIQSRTLIPNGASSIEFSSPDPGFRKKYKIPDGQPLLLTVGSHTGAKGHAVVMEAFRRARIGPATLVIVGNTFGSAGCLPRCRFQAQLVRLSTFGQKRVLLLDPPRTDVLAAYAAADLFVFGSNVECSPIVLFEAAASKTPFLSTACGNAQEIAEWTDSGVILPTRRNSDGSVQTNAAAAARGIEDLFADRRRLDKLAKTGYDAWSNRFTWEKIALEYERLYLQLVQS
ncbi:MAG TPA: glycosyltransferase family 4 protein [Terriglobia bacterium]|jgi:glycosyltransferase involved in cell wall biosynthesis